MCKSITPIHLDTEKLIGDYMKNKAKQLNVELQVVLTKPKIAMLVMLTAIGMATDAVAKKIIDSSVKVNQVESKESTSKS